MSLIRSNTVKLERAKISLTHTRTQAHTLPCCINQKRSDKTGKIIQLDKQINVNAQVFRLPPFILVSDIAIDSNHVDREVGGQPSDSDVYNHLNRL